jgi:hypothetical protein
MQANTLRSCCSSPGHVTAGLVATPFPRAEQVLRNAKRDSAVSGDVDGTRSSGSRRSVERPVSAALGRQKPTELESGEVGRRGWYVRPFQLSRQSLA